MNKSNASTNLPSPHNNEIVDEILNLPKEGVIDNIEKHSSNGAGFYTSVTMGDVTHTVLIDTGCTYTLIPRKLFDATGIPFHPVGDIKLRLASGEHFMMGAWVGPITFKVGSQWFNQLIIVAESGNEMILGMDFMRRHKTALVISEGIFILNGEPIKLIDEDDIKTPKIIAARRVTLEPCTSRWVEAKLQGSNSYHKPLVCESMQQGCTIVGPAEYRPNQPLHLLVFNATDRYLTIKSGKQIAETEELHPLYQYKQDELDSKVMSTKDTAQVEPEANKAKENATTKQNENENKQSDKQKFESFMTVWDHYHHGEKPQGGWIIDEIDKIKETDPIPEVPEHLTSTFKEGCEHLTGNFKHLFAKLLIRYSDVFSKDDYDVGCVTGIEHTIPTGDTPPARVPPRRINRQFAHIEEEITRKLLEKNLIAPASSEYCAAPVLLRKKQGGYRYAIDYRLLNSRTLKLVHPLTRIEDCLDFLQGNKIFSRLDAAQGYWQIPMAAQDAHKTAFQNRFGCFLWKVMPNGLQGASRTYSLMMESCLHGLLFKIVMNYLDDVILPSKDLISHLLGLQIVLERFKLRGVKLKPIKCVFFKPSINVLGREATGETVEMSNKDIETVAKWPTPKSRKDVERWLGLANYHRQYMKDFAQHARPLYELLKLKKFHWTETHQLAFDALKKGLTTAPVLGLPTEDGQFILDTDASLNCIGAELIQLQDDREVVISYSSASLSKAQTHYCATKRELLSMIYHCRHYRHHLLGRQFIARTDASSLRWLASLRNAEGQLMRWLEELSQYDMIIVHRKGKLHTNADSLSRLLDPNHTIRDVELKDLPCKGCTKCQIATAKWADFYNNVDDVVPLSIPKSQVQDTSYGCKLLDEPLGLGTKENTGKPPKVTLPKAGEEAKSSPEGVRAILGTQYTAEAPVPSSAQTARQAIPRAAPTADTHASQQAGPSHQLTPLASQQAAGDTPHQQGLDQESNLTLPDLFNDDDDESDFEGFTENEIIIPQNIQQWGMTPEEIAEAQRNDDDIGPIYEWVSTEISPSDQQLKASSPATRHYWLHKGQLKLINQIIYLEKPEDTQHKLLLPRTFVDRVLNKLHNDPMAGHMGGDKTKHSALRRFYWFGMRGEINLFIKNCHPCQRMKGPNRAPRHEMALLPSGYVMERVHIDHMGPLPATQLGNQHILVMVDAFSKFVWAAAVPDQKTETTANVLVKWFSEYGIPHTIVSDQGMAFESRLIHSLCNQLKISKLRTTPFRPSANGLAERQNKTIATIIRTYCSRDPNTWDLYLPIAISAIRNTQSRITGFTPNKIFYGREITTPVDVEFALAPGEKREVHEYVANLIKDLQKVHQMVRSNTLDKIKKQKNNYDIRVLQREYNIGDAVYLLNKQQVGVPKKLLPVWLGPAMIIRKYSSFVYKIRLHFKTKVVNHDTLKPCHGKIPKWIQRGRLNNPEEFQEPDFRNGPYCICRRGMNEGEDMMICCEYCDEWFHLECISLTRTQAKRLGVYQCQECQGEDEAFRITYHDRYSQQTQGEEAADG